MQEAAMLHRLEQATNDHDVEALADCFMRALDLDLVTADDFAAGRLHSPTVRRMRT